jgi:phage terminase small subunit
MGGAAGTQGDELSPRQGTFVAAYLQSGSISQAAEAAGYASEHGGRAALASVRVQAALKEARAAILTSEAANEALVTMRELLKPGIPPAVRFGASKWILELAGHTKDADDDGSSKPMHEMTEAELHRFMAKARRVMEGGGEPPLITVVPDSGALPDDPDTRDG